MLLSMMKVTMNHTLFQIAGYAATTIVVSLCFLSEPAVAATGTSAKAGKTSFTPARKVEGDRCLPESHDVAKDPSEIRTVKLLLGVNPKGVVVSATVAVSSGDESTDQATLAAAKSCSFWPALRNGKAVASSLAFTHVWKLTPTSVKPQGADSSKSTARLNFAECVKPVYPQASLRNEETGTVGMMFLIGKDGLVKEKKIVRSTGFRELDVAALNAIGMCVFKPATENGEPIESWMPMQYVWTLE